MQLAQHVNLRKLKELLLDASFSKLRSVQMKLAWSSHTRPEYMFEISHLAQLTEENSEKDSERL